MTVFKWNVRPESPWEIMVWFLCLRVMTQARGQLCSRYPAPKGPSRMAVAADAALWVGFPPALRGRESVMWTPGFCSGFEHLLSVCFLINGDISESGCTEWCCWRVKLTKLCSPCCGKTLVESNWQMSYLQVSVLQKCDFSVLSAEFSKWFWELAKKPPLMLQLCYNIGGR